MNPPDPEAKISDGVKRRPRCVYSVFTKRNDYASNRNADCGVAFAWANIAVPA